MRRFRLCGLCGSVACAILLVGTMRAADLAGVVVRLEDDDGPATLAAELVDPHKLKLTVDPKAEREPLVIRVELPISGRNAWPVADVEVRDAQGRAVAVRRSGIEWHKLLIPVPVARGACFVQAVDPPGGRPALPGEQARRIADEGSGLRLSVARWHDNRRAALSIRFDDSHPTHLTTAIPILREYGFRGTFMINPGAQEAGSRRRSAFQDHLSDWQAVAERGDQEFANHSAHHRGAVGDADMEAEIGEAAQAIWRLSPGKSKLTALNLGGGTVWETTHTLRHYLDKYHHFDASQGSLGMDDVYGDRVAAFRRMLEQHIQRGLWCRIHYHYIGEGLSSSEANFRAALEVAKQHQADLWIAGMADIYKYQTEREASSLALVKSSPRQLSFKLACLTDGELYDQPLTIEAALPESWRPDRIAVIDGQGKAVAVRTAQSDGRVVCRFELPPRTATCTIQMAQ